MGDVSDSSRACDSDYEALPCPLPLKRSRVGPQYQAAVPDTLPGSREEGEEARSGAEGVEMMGTLVWTPSVLCESQVESFITEGGGRPQSCIRAPQRTVEALLEALHAAHYDPKAALADMRARDARQAGAPWSANDWSKFARAHLVLGFDFDSIAQTV
eukprot:m51a1_g1264 hypothetical protein (158) ;mRNA; r:62674-63442